MKYLIGLFVSAACIFCAAGCFSHSPLTDEQKQILGSVRTWGVKGDFSDAEKLCFHDPVNGKTPLIYTITDRLPDKFRQILALEGAEELLEMKDDNGMTALQYAAEMPDNTYLKALIAAKADVNTRDRFGRTPLMNVCRLGNVAAFDLLLSAGADPEARDQQDRSIAMFAAAASRNSVQLLKKIRTLDKENDAWMDFGDNAQCPLTCAIDAGNREGTDLLLEATCPQDLSKATDAQNVYALLAMKHAVKAGNIHLAKNLIQRKLPLNRDLSIAYKSLKRVQLKNWHRTFARAGIISDGKLPLSWAAEKDDVEMIKLLLASGADPYCKDHYGAYPIEYTRKPGAHNTLKRAMQKAIGK